MASPKLFIFLFSTLFSLFFLCLTEKSPGGTRLENGQTDLVVNAFQQSMSNPERGPRGRYAGAHRFKFLMARAEPNETCTGEILLCYPSHLDPEKNFGISQVPRHEQMSNEKGNPVAAACEERRWKCVQNDSCTMMADTPWHGIRVRYLGNGERLEFATSMGATYEFDTTHFTLSLHNNEVNDEADSAAYLINDFDYRDTCLNQNDDPEGPKPEFRIHPENDEKAYEEYKATAATNGYLQKYHKQLFHLSWDMMPVPLDQDAEDGDHPGDGDFMFIWTENTAICRAPDAQKWEANKTSHVFFMNQMQTELNNYYICTTEAPKTTLRTELQCPGGPTWEYVEPAKLSISRGSKVEEHLVVRVGFVWKNENQTTTEFKNGWEKANRDIRDELVPAKLPDFDKGEFYYASVQEHFGFDNATNKGVWLQMHVWHCTFGKMTTQLRTIIPEEGQKVGEIADYLKWAKDFDIADCNETQKLVIVEQKVIRNQTENWFDQDLDNLTANNDGAITIGNNSLNKEFKIAHAFKFGYVPKGLPNLNETAEERAEDYAKVRKYGRFLLGETPDLYAEWNITKMFVRFKEVSKKMVQAHNYTKSNDKAGLKISKSCARSAYCDLNYSNNSRRSPKFCESINADYECKKCDNIDYCNIFHGHKCWTTKGKFILAESKFEPIGDEGDTCGSSQPICIEEVCEGNGLHIRKSCAAEDHCENEKMAKKLKEKCMGLNSPNYTCTSCRNKDNCNLKSGNRTLNSSNSTKLTRQKCWTTYRDVETEPSLGFVELKKGDNEETIGNENHMCPDGKPMCVTEVCHENKSNTKFIWKHCAAQNYCQNARNLNNSEKYCKEAFDAHYMKCFSCNNRSNCNGIPVGKKCLSTNGFEDKETEEDSAGRKTTCGRDRICVTEICRPRPSQYIAYGVMALQYRCPNNTQFLMPRFDGVFLNGKKGVSDPRKMEPLERNWATEYTVNGGKKIKVDTDKLEKCRYNVVSGEAMEDCKDDEEKKNGN